jgi:hypothetical protein
MKPYTMKNKYQKKFARLLFATVVMMFTFSKPVLSQVLNTQSFDAATFPPAGWANTITAGSYAWARVTSGTGSTSGSQSPHTGAGEAQFQWAGTSAILVTPAYDLSGIGTNTATVSFWMFRDGYSGYNTSSYPNVVNVYENTSPNLTGAVLLGSVHRAISLSPAVASEGWYQYTYNVPATFTTTSNYLIFSGVGNQSGDDIYIDDVAWTSYPCLVVGGVASSNSTLCAGSSTSLSLSGQDAGATLQWQSSPNNSVWSNMPGETAATYTSGALASTTYFRCAVTNVCTNYSNVVTTTIVQAISGTATGPSTVCTGATATLTLTGNSGTKQWQSSPDNITWTNIPGATTSPYTTAAINSPTYYRAKVSNSPCADVFSNVLHITLNTIPVAPTSIFGSTMPCIGSTTTYSTAAIANATTYNWTAPLGSSIQSGTGTNIITVLIGASSGAISVSAGDACGTSPTASITITPQSSAPAAPGAISGPTTICAGSSGNYSIAAVANTAYYKWAVPAGSTVSTGQGTNSVSILWGSTSGNVTVKDSSGCGISAASSLSVTVNPSVTPALSIALSSGSNPMCAGASVTFSATPTNGGTTPAYQWKVNGSNVGTNSTSYTSTTLTNGQVVSCALTSNASCALPATVNSNSITVTVNSIVTPSITINISSGNNPACSGSSVTFSASPTNGGTTPAYQWQVNGSNVGTNSSSFTSSAFTNGQTVTCILTSNAVCTSASTATSTATTMTVNPMVTPSVTTSIASGNNPMCAGSSVTFSVSVTDGGTTPAYQWQVNSSNVGTNSSSYTSSALSNGETITCILTSNANCATASTATSTATTMTVNPMVTPSVATSITSGNNPMCAGSSVTFSASITDGGTSPSYQWQVNGSNVGINTSSYTSTTLANSDNVTCILTSNANCATTSTATSTAITMTVNTSVTPSVATAITSGNNPMCAGSSITFSTSITDGGTTPAYQWQVNGSNVGTNSSSYSSSTLATGDNVTCVLTSNASCATTPTATSNITTMQVNSLPNVTANATQTVVCNGANVTLTGSGAVSYAWTNSVTDGVPFAPSSTQTYTVTGTDNNNCVNTSMITVNVSSLPTVSANATHTSICTGDTVILTGSGAISYVWSNGVTDGVQFTPTATQNYTVTGIDGNGCQNSDTITVAVSSCSMGMNQLVSNKTQIVLFPNPSTSNILIKSTAELGLVKVYNSLGEVIFEAMISENEKQVDLTKQTPGIYFFSVQGKYIRVIKE